MDRCPTCQARLRQEPVCPRCRTDLTRLLAIRSRADSWLHRAILLMAQGDEPRAMRAVETSLRLKREPLALLLRGFLSHSGQLHAREKPEQLAEISWKNRLFHEKPWRDYIAHIGDGLFGREGIFARWRGKYSRLFAK